MQNKDKIELRYLWQSFLNLKKYLKFDIRNAEKTYNQLVKKLT